MITLKKLNQALRFTDFIAWKSENGYVIGKVLVTGPNQPYASAKTIKALVDGVYTQDDKVLCKQYGYSNTPSFDEMPSLMKLKLMNCRGRRHA